MDFVMRRRKVREIMGRLIGKKVDDTFCLFPPFYTVVGGVPAKVLKKV